MRGGGGNEVQKKLSQRFFVPLVLCFSFSPTRHTWAQCAGNKFIMVENPSQLPAERPDWGVTLNLASSS